MLVYEFFQEVEMFSRNLSGEATSQHDNERSYIEDKSVRLFFFLFRGFVLILPSGL